MQKNIENSNKAPKYFLKTKKKNNNSSISFILIVLFDLHIAINIYNMRG